MELLESTSEFISDQEHLDLNIICSREHMSDVSSLTNLFCNQISRMSHDLLDQGQGDGGKGRGGRRPGGRGGRCGLHSNKKETKQPYTMTHMYETWNNMVEECREEVVLLPFSLVRSTLDRYLKRHRFCKDCAYMVNKAYFLFVEDGEVIPSLLMTLIYH